MRQREQKIVSERQQKDRKWDRGKNEKRMSKRGRESKRVVSGKTQGNCCM